MAEVYARAGGLEVVEVSVSTRPESSSARSADWDRAEALLVAAVKRAGFECGIKPGEAAFYAPKVEVDFRDVLGRDLDPRHHPDRHGGARSRFGLRYVGTRRRAAPARHVAPGGARLDRALPRHLHRAHRRRLPFWLTPVQAVLCPDRRAPHALRPRDAPCGLFAQGVRVELDDRSETLGFKIREAETQKVPLMLVVGDQEQENGTVNASPGGGAAASDQGAMSPEVLVGETGAEQTPSAARIPFPRRKFAFRIRSRFKRSLPGFGTRPG